jgi:hypothetical protein
MKPQKHRRLGLEESWAKNILKQRRQKPKTGLLFAASDDKDECSDVIHALGVDDRPTNSRETRKDSEQHTLNLLAELFRFDTIQQLLHRLQVERS